MSRSRIIKPGFFTNDRLAEVSPLGRILFAGLWTMADRKGRLEDRPKRIKAEILPFDNANVERLLTDLEARGFITRYSVAGDHFIAVTSFEKHQNPHIREAESTIPAPPATAQSTVPAPDEHGPSTVLAPDEHQTSTAYARAQDPVQFSSISDSVFFAPSPVPDGETPPAKKGRYRKIGESDIARWEGLHPGIDIRAMVADYENWKGSSDHHDKVQGFENQLRLGFKRDQFAKGGPNGNIVHIGAPPNPPVAFDFEAYERDQAELSKKRHERVEARRAREAEAAPDDAS